MKKRYYCLTIDLKCGEYQFTEYYYSFVENLKISKREIINSIMNDFYGNGNSYYSDKEWKYFNGEIIGIPSTFTWITEKQCSFLMRL